MTKNGQQAGQEAVHAFIQWAARRTDADFRAMANERTGLLSRAEVVEGCRSFQRRALTQNPNLALELKKLEDSLRERGVLPPLAQLDAGPEGVDEAEPVRARGQVAAGSMASRLKSLENQVSVLRAENTELRQRIKKFEVLEGVLARTGRLPR